MALGSVFARTTGGGGVIGGATVRLVLDSAHFDAGLAKSQSKLQAFGAGMSRVGGAMTRGLTVPIVAAGAVATKMALDYEAAFTKIRSVTTAADKDIDKWKESLHSLAAQTGVDATSLAEGLYFIAQPSLDAAETMDILKLSAKGAALGLGEMGTVGMTLSQVMNAYSKTGQTATDTMDTWTAAVMAGVSEPEEWAGAMGRVLGISAQAGIEFENLAASLASLTAVGVDVNEGVTAMRGFLLALSAPGSMAAETMEEIGLSAEQLRGVLAEDGLLGAMRLLEDASNGNIDTMRKIVPNVRSLAGFMNITGQEAKTVDEVFRMVANSTGTMDEAFKELQEDPAFKMRQSMAKLKSTAIEVGQALLPVVTDIVGKVGDLVGGFTKLDPAMQGNIIKWGLIVAAAGPVLSIFGKLIGIIPKLVTGFGPLGVAIGLLGFGLYDAWQNARKLETGTSTLSEKLLAGEIAVRDITAATNDLVAAQEDASLANAAAERGEDILNLSRLKAAQAVQELYEKVNLLPGALNEARTKQILLKLANDDFAGALQQLMRWQDAWLDNLVEGQEGLAELTTEYDRLIAASERASQIAREERRNRREAAEETKTHSENMNELETSIRRVPKQVKVKTEADTKPAKTEVVTFITWTKGKETEVRVDADTAAAFGSVRALIAYINGVNARINLGLGGNDHAGGLIMHSGGTVRGRGDNVPTVLQRGEFVVSKAAVQRFGAANLAAINQGRGGAGGVSVHIDTVNVGDADDAEDVGFNLGRGLRRGYLQKAGLN